MIEYDAKQEIAMLTTKINKWNTEYFQENDPTVSDEHYDRSFRDLLDLEHKFPHLRLPNSPTESPGSDLSKGFPKHVHDYPMLSIQNALNIEELKRWIKKVKPYYGSMYSFSAEQKLDGLALSLIYNNGRLIKAVTRGDGIEGDVVTSNALKVKGVKPFVNLPPGRTEIRGEVVMSFKTFERYKKEYKNPRNLVSGTMKLHDPEEVAARELEFFAYEVVGGYCDNYWEDRIIMVDKGFSFAPGFLISETEIELRCEVFEATRKNSLYPIDGVVIKLCDYSDRQKMGKTSKFHHWQIAYKFDQESVRSTLLSVDHQVGRTGVITPVANVRPVEILGTTVRRASLHNYDQVLKLDIRLGDTVFLEKGGDIIPKIVGVETKNRKHAEPIEAPDKCPSCGSKPKKEGAIYLCYNTSCPSQVQGRAEHFVSKKCMNIKGVGPSTIESFIDWRMNKLSDMYDYEPDDIYNMGYGEVETDNIYEAIQGSKKPELWRFINALGIPLIGERASKEVADYYKNIDDLMIEVFDLTEGEIKGFGPEMTNSIVDWFIKNSDDVEDLLDIGVEPIHKIANKPSEYSGKTVVITGKLSMSRDEIKMKLEDMGIKITNSISKNTDYLIVGDKPGSKLDKAKHLDINIVKETFFFGI